MAFNYECLSEEEAMKEKNRPYELLPEGVYALNVIDAFSRKSDAGNPVMDLKLKYTREDSRNFLVFDVLVGTKGMAWKIKHFCDSANLSKEYEAKSFDDYMAKGKVVFAKVIIESGKMKKDGSLYADRNVIEDYVKPDENMVVHKNKEEPFFNDDLSDIPF